MDVSIGVPPAAGWKWAALDFTLSSEAAFPSGHPPAMLYTLEGIHQDTTEGLNRIPPGKAWFNPAGVGHSHAPWPAGTHTRFLAFVAVPGNGQLPPLSPSTKMLLVSEEPEEVEAGTPYMMRLRKLTFPPGAVRPEPTGGSGPRSIWYVLDGTYTFGTGTSDTQTEAGMVFVKPNDLSHVDRNDGNEVLTVLVADLRPERP